VASCSVIEFELRTNHLFTLKGEFLTLSREKKSSFDAIFGDLKAMCLKSSK